MEQLKTIKQCLVSAVQTQLGDLKKTDAKELGEVIDMIKDLEEAMYYCSITEAMEKSAEEKQQSNMNVNYYMEPMYYKGQARDSMGRYISDGRRRYEEPMYYNNNSNSQGSNSQSSDTRNYVPYMEYAPYMMQDENWRDNHMYNGRSGMSRRMYMEGKQYHSNDDQQSMKELEHYIKDLGEDLTDMIKESTPEEKQVLSTKLQQLATKINK